MRASWMALQWETTMGWSAGGVAAGVGLGAGVAGVGLGVALDLDKGDSKLDCPRGVSYQSSMKCLKAYPATCLASPDSAFPSTFDGEPDPDFAVELLRKTVLMRLIYLDRPSGFSPGGLDWCAVDMFPCEPAVYRAA